MYPVALASDRSLARFDKMWYVLGISLNSMLKDVVFTDQSEARETSKFRRRNTKVRRAEGCLSTICNGLTMTHTK